MMLQVADWEKQLDDLALPLREDALARLVRLMEQGAVSLEPEREIVNLHCHTFFSYNAYGYSPAALAWHARRRGLRAIGIVDFDVLDGVDEFLRACDRVGVRGSAGLETRVFIPEFAGHEINSPGEPGIAYYMGIGFTSSRPRAGSASTLDAMRARAARRTREMVTRVNAYLDPVAIDYEHDVAPLTPAGNATERHLLAAYVRAAEEGTPNPAAFWAERLALSAAEMERLFVDGPRLQNTIRLKLMKRGGVGYVQPTPESFPTVEQVNRFVVENGGLPCYAWLDGTSEGEAAIEKLLDLLIGKGLAALNIIPDRNWNLPDPETKRRKVQKLYEVAALARELDLPLHVGTEMNAFGQRWVDDFDAPELAPLRQDFLDGAYFIYGHTMLQRAAGLGYSSAWARAHLPSRRERNRFYRDAGLALPPGAPSRARVRQLDPSLSPAALLAQLNATEPA